MPRPRLWFFASLLLAAACARPNPLFEHKGDGGHGAPDAALAGPDGGPGPGPNDAPSAVDASAPAPPDAGVPPDAGLPDLARSDSRDATVAPEIDLTTGLVAHWTFDEGTGEATVADATGNGNSGAVVAPLDPNTSWQPGEEGTSLLFPDQISAAVLVPPSPSLDSIRGAFTISAWIYRTASVGGRHAAAVSRQYLATSREIYNLAVVNDNLIFWTIIDATTTPSPFSVRSPRTIPLATWVHVAVTWDGATIRLYESGAVSNTGAFTGPLPSCANPVVLGNNANVTGLDQPLVGRLDEVRLYDRALPPAAIAALARP